MKRFVLLIALVVALGAVANAIPVCGSNPGQNVLVGNYSCTLGGLIFDNFSASPNWTPPPNPVINIMGTSNFTNGVVYLNFNPNLYNVDVGDPPLDLYFQFRVLGSVNQIDLYVAGTGAVVSEYVCDAQGWDPNGGCIGQQLANISRSSGQTRVWAYFFPDHSYTGPIWVWKDINVHYSGENPGELSLFSQSFHVPEPLTLTLIGSGLLGFGLLRRRLKK